MNLASSLLYTARTGNTLTQNQLIQSYIRDQINHVKVIPNKNGIRIATYNVHFWLDPTAMESNYPEILQVIQDLNADILVLEEVSFDTISQAKLYQDLTNLGYQDIEFCDAEPQFGNLIASKYPILNSRIIVLPYYADGRCAVVADIQINSSSAPSTAGAAIRTEAEQIIRVYGFHLDVFDETEATRLAQIETILNDAALAVGRAAPTILTGDFNSLRRNDYTPEEWSTIQYIDQSRGIQSQTLVTDLLESSGWRTSFDRKRSPSPKYTVWSGRTVDFIYLSPNWYFPIKNTFVYHTAASDHLPVIMDF